MSGGVNERVQEFIIIQLCTCLSHVCHVDMYLRWYSTVSLCTGQVQVREKHLTLASLTFLPSPHEACLLVRSDEMCLPHEACLLDKVMRCACCVEEKESLLQLRKWRHYSAAHSMQRGCCK